MMKRYVAIKSRISDIINSEMKEDEIGRYLQLGDIKARRIHIVGVVSNSYFNSETQLAFFKITTPFKHTTTQEKEISVRFFRDDVKRAQGGEDGALVRVIGKIKEFKGERYILGEILTNITALDAELFRADIINISGEFSVKETVRETESSESSNGGVEKKIFQYIKDNSSDKNGVKYTKLVSAFCENGKGKIDEDTLDRIVNDLLSSGNIFEPKIGRFKELK